MGPLIDEEGNNLASEQFENIVKERYLISKRSNISYSDTADISVLERMLLLKFIQEEIEAEKKKNEEFNQKIKKR